MPGAPLPAAIELLAADGPAPTLAEGLSLFGRFVGSWDVESVVYDLDGSERREPCEWHFAWVLGGRAVQDVLFRAGAPPQQRGTTLRAYDERSGLWHVTWTAPAAGQFVHLVARAVPEGILLEGRTADGRSDERWRFSEIRPDAFTWRGECSLDGGRSWRLQQVMQARRRRGAGRGRRRPSGGRAPRS
jgi:hypothetical protein